MEQITYDNVVARLRVAVPEYCIDRDDAESHLHFLVFSDLTRFAAKLIAEGGATSVVARIFDFIEQASSSQDARIIEVTTDSLHELAVRCPDEAHDCMGPRSRRLFEPVLDNVFGPPSLRTRFVRTIRSLRARPPN